MSRPMPKKDEKVRITIDLSPELYDRLCDLEKRVGADSKSSLLRNALRLYEFAATSALNGETFKVVDKDGIEKPIQFFGNAFVAKQGM